MRAAGGQPWGAKESSLGPMQLVLGLLGTAVAADTAVLVARPSPSTQDCVMRGYGGGWLVEEMEEDGGVCI